MEFYKTLALTTMSEKADETYNMQKTLDAMKYVFKEFKNKAARKAIKKFKTAYRKGNNMEALNALNVILCKLD